MKHIIVIEDVLAEEFKKIVGEKQVLFKECLAPYTTFKIGGCAEIMIKPKSIEEIQNIIRFLKKEQKEYIVLGGCSNVLISDSGINSIVIKMDKEHFFQKEQQEEFLSVLAGAEFAQIAKDTVKEGYKGLEFAVGIPGSIGGAVFMNAGAYDGEISTIIDWVEAVMPDGELKRFYNEDCKFNYRQSIFQRNKAVIVKVMLKLEKCANIKEQELLQKKVKDITLRRESKQPLEWASAGSTFKRPKGFFTGPLIEQAGMKGYTFGRAQVSEKHAGFIINRGEATFDEIVTLINKVIKKVEQTSGVKLEPEVRIIE